VGILKVAKRNEDSFELMFKILRLRCATLRMTIRGLRYAQDDN